MKNRGRKTIGEEIENMITVGFTEEMPFIVAE